MKMTLLLLPLLCCLGCSDSARVFFKEPADGATVKVPFKIVFGLEGMELVKAGERTGDKTCGHHHVLVDRGSVAEGTVIPPDNETCKHFGAAQPETMFTEALSPGKHKLTLQFADAVHKSYGKGMSASITVTVE